MQAQLCLACAGSNSILGHAFRSQHCDSNGGGLESDKPIDSIDLLREGLLNVARSIALLMPTQDVSTPDRTPASGETEQSPPEYHIPTVDHSIS